MPSGTRDACLLALALFLGSCAQKPAGVDHDATTAAEAPAADTDATPYEPEPEPGLDQAIEDVPPATAPAAASILASASIDFSGVGPVPFGAGVEALQQAWDGRLQGPPPADGATCHYLSAQTPPAPGHGLRFMIEDGRFVRVDVDDPATAAPGGGRVGMSAVQIEALYPGQVERRPHKYVEGAAYLRVAREGSAAVLLFETDAGGAVQAWRLGLPPQVDYVEGCG